jgi:hypothetical protein
MHSRYRRIPPQLAVRHHIEAVANDNPSGKAVVRVPSPFFTSVGIASGIAFGNPRTVKIFWTSTD